MCTCCLFVCVWCADLSDTDACCHCDLRFTFSHQQRRSKCDFCPVAVQTWRPVGWVQQLHYWKHDGLETSGRWRLLVWLQSSASVRLLRLLGVPRHPRLAGSSGLASPTGRPLPLNFSLSENFLLLRNFFSKTMIFETVNLPVWWNLGAKLKFWAPIISLVSNFQLAVEKLQLIALLA